MACLTVTIRPLSWKYLTRGMVFCLKLVRRRSMALGLSSGRPCCSARFCSLSFKWWLVQARNTTRSGVQIYQDREEVIWSIIYHTDDFSLFLAALRFEFQSHFLDALGAIPTFSPFRICDDSFLFWGQTWGGIYKMQIDTPRRQYSLTSTECVNNVWLRDTICCSHIHKTWNCLYFNKLVFNPLVQWLKKVNVNR